eukprot:gene15834-21961_t
MSRERASLRGSSSYPSQKFPPPVVLLDSGARAYSLGTGEPSEANLEDLLALGETTSTMPHVAQRNPVTICRYLSKPAAPLRQLLLCPPAAALDSPHLKVHDCGEQVRSTTLAPCVSAYDYHQ